MSPKVTARNLVLAVLLFCVSVGTASAQFSVTLRFDKDGTGRLTNTAGANLALPASNLTDPGPGGLSSVLFYNMLNPPGLTVGDVVITEGSATSDILRFNASLQRGGVFVYSSDTTGGLRADVGLPTALNAIRVTIAKPANCLVSYTPTTGQPGFVAGAAGPVTYIFTAFGPVKITSLAASPNVLWPPNHQQVDVSVTAAATLGCGVLSCKIISVTSNEPTAGTDAVASGDAVITGNLALKLKAARLGNNDGRTYTITVQCKDANGNATTKTVTVLVPHDQGNNPFI